VSQCLQPCPSCAQHLRTTETVCPFCDAALPPGWGVCAQPAARGRPMSRAALLFVSATVATSCGGTTASQPTDDGGRAADGGHEAATDSGGGDLDGPPVTLYGPGPVFDSGPHLDATPDAPSEAATDAQTGEDAPAVLYGPATIDAGG
jgi:hypothetical protein